MSANELLQLSAHFDRWVRERGEGLLVKPFYYYCVEHVLKSVELTDQELLAGITDGENDGGIDALYFFLDGQAVSDETVLPNTYAQSPKVRLILFQIKDGPSGFSVNEIDKMAKFVPDLLDVSGPSIQELRVHYNETLLQIIKTFRETFAQIAGYLPEVAIECFYITKGDGVTPDAKSTAAADRVKAAARGHMGSAKFNFQFVSAQRLLEIIQQRPATTKRLQFDGTPLGQAEHYVGVVRLVDYFQFLQDEAGFEQKRLYESNVRGYQRSTRVNKQIAETLDSGAPDFWLLNNGITILATQATPLGGSTSITITDPQIVNGLQTSRAIFNHFAPMTPPLADDRRVLVRIIVSNDAKVYDEIVRATNSQNPMPAASLRATDQIHRQIEDYFLTHGLFYDRRRGHYKDLGKPIQRIVSITELLQAVVSIVLHKPNDARARPGDYINNEPSYNSVFGKDRVPLSVYLTCIGIMRLVEARISEKAHSYGDRRNVRFYVAYRLVCNLNGGIEPTTPDLEALDLERATASEIDGAFEQVWTAYCREGGNDVIAKGPLVLSAIKAPAAPTTRTSARPVGRRRNPARNTSSS